jgi:hypothetical protein
MATSAELPCDPNVVSRCLRCLQKLIRHREGLRSFRGGEKGVRASLSSEDCPRGYSPDKRGLSS